MLKQEKGVTLIAIMLTVVVIAILATITFNMATQDTGVVTKTKETSRTTFDNNVVNALVGIQSTYTSKSEFITRLVDSNYATKQNSGSEYVINVKNLLNLSDCKYGVGTDKDIYTLSADLKLSYTDLEGTKNQIHDLGQDMEN